MLMLQPTRQPRDHSASAREARSSPLGAAPPSTNEAVLQSSSPTLTLVIISIPSIKAEGITMASSLNRSLLRSAVVASRSYASSSTAAPLRFATAAPSTTLYSARLFSSSIARSLATLRPAPHTSPRAHTRHHPTGQDRHLRRHRRTEPDRRCARLPGLLQGPLGARQGRPALLLHRDPARHVDRARKLLPPALHIMYPSRRARSAHASAASTRCDDTPPARSAASPASSARPSAPPRPSPSSPSRARTAHAGPPATTLT